MINEVVIYVSERTALTINKVRPYFKDPHKTNPLDIYVNKHLDRYTVIHE